MPRDVISLQRISRRLSVACAIFGLLAAATPVAAEQTAVARTGVKMTIPGVIASTADMNFGSIGYTPTAGTVVLSAAANPVCTTTGSLVHIGPCTAAKFEGSVRFLFTLQVSQPDGDSISLSGPGGATLKVDKFSYGAGPGLWDLGQAGANHRFLILNLDGSYSFYIGGTIHVGANQAPGVYQGNFQIQLNYN